ncbi:HAD-IA family hydrolase [Pseudonocardia endophytica]|uniref:HAD superfamily hydrolase (TIGR01509 family) n=1 Tax=Pseudonocardia endophytica TaxID=401976 RepID=A0A4R1HWZ1_PSEEN|nr:HAD-IA family hydrolase [Pseudonocardia endophytica]TCK25605.1 HAD superfamily hydrolase (TIGR01509 family) [Pseudonocardia endophytica]
MPAILFGSISTVADTSELQRDAFNRAFADHGLDWHWDRDTYVAMLNSNGGADRVAEYARSRGVDVDADAIHRTKSETFRRLLRASPPKPRLGVPESVSAARRDGTAVALVTTTSPENVAALVEALTPQLGDQPFDLLVDRGQVSEPKPDGAAYRFALDKLGVRAEDAVAIEDNVGGVQAAREAGVAVVAFPNENTSGHDFGPAAERVDRIEYGPLRAHLGENS